MAARRFSVELTGPRGSVGRLRWVTGCRMVSAVVSAFLEAHGSAIVITGETFKGLQPGQSSTFASSSGAALVRVTVYRLEVGA